MQPLRSRNGITVISACFAISLVLFLLTCGCTSAQPASPAAPASSVAPPAPAASPYTVTVSQPDTGHIVVTYEGGPDIEKLMEIETWISDSHGMKKTQSAGDRLSTTPLQLKGTDTISGSFEGSDHVVVTGYFADGSHAVLLDTYI
jgi:hypothetical protein